MAKHKDESSPQTPRATNRKAWHEYQILEKLECGLELTGSEVKSIRAGNVRIEEAYAKIRGGELYLVGANIAQYPQALPNTQHEPTRERKLLAHRRQILQIEAHVKQKGKTLIPLAIYFKGGHAKCEIGVAVGKKQYDKRQDAKKRDHQREMTREMRRRNR